jgi:threonine dehydrogenase-like Zn-dependent dehydrogenase
MPRELVCVEGKRLEWREYADGPLASGRVRLRSQFAAAKHGTELAICKGYGAARGQFDRRYGLFLKTGKASGGAVAVGNMVVGEVVEAAADVTSPAVGQRALAYGPFRQTHALPAGACWQIPPSLSWKSAVCLDPADFAMAAVRDGHVRVGDAVAVFGLGAIGLMAVQLARLAGATVVIGIDPLGERRTLASALGAAPVLHPGECDAGLEIKKATGGRGADVIIEYSGSRQALQAALRGVAYGGNVVAGAFPPPYDAGLDLGAEAHLNIPNLIFSRACSQPDRDHPRWDERRIQQVCLQWFIEGRLSGETVVTPVATVETVAEEYLEVLQGRSSAVKLGLAW